MIYEENNGIRNDKHKLETKCELNDFELFRFALYSWVQEGNGTHYCFNKDYVKTMEQIFGKKYVEDYENYLKEKTSGKEKEN